MKFKSIAVAAILVAIGLSSCEKSTYEKVWDEYEEWRVVNENWFAEQEATGEYTTITPEWNPSQHILMRWQNDTTLTSGNLRPLYTSTILVKYIGKLCNDLAFDSTYELTDSVTTLQPSSLIDGWVIALEKMRVGDKVDIVVPYGAGYGSTESGTVPPFSTLQFEIELRDIPTYELRPE